jgi:putative transposase
VLNDANLPRRSHGRIRAISQRPAQPRIARNSFLVDTKISLMSVARSTLRYKSRLVQRDAPAVAVMRELAAQYLRYATGASRCSWASWAWNERSSRAHRLWGLHGLQVPRKRPRKRSPVATRTRCRQRARTTCGRMTSSSMRVRAPNYLRSDNDPECIYRAILRWLIKATIDTAFINPGKPW